MYLFTGQQRVETTIILDLILEKAAENDEEFLSKLLGIGQECAILI